MLNLILDVGNTRVKLALYELDILIFKQVTSVVNFKKDFTEIENLYALVKNVLISSTGALKDDDLNYLKQKYNVIQLDNRLRIPFNNLYKTPKTIGADRLALVAAAVLHYPKKNVLIIDAGTCITYDFVSENKNYYGGAISLGLDIRYKALHDYTVSLPYLMKKSVNDFIGNSTNSSIHSGVVNGTIQEIDGVISQYHNKYQDLTIILTGGDANFLSKQLKSSIFAHSNFLMEGLNFILNYNLK